MVLSRRVATLLCGQSRNRLLNFPNLGTARTHIYVKVTPIPARRTYATPGRPKKAVGEISRPVKKRATKSGTPKATKVAAKPKAKKKPVAKAKKPAKKPPTEAQVKAKAARVRRAELKELKALALLDAPTPFSANGWVMFLQERIRGKKGNISELTKEVGPEYTALTPSEKQPYETQAVENKKQRAAEYAAWLEKHTPEEIRKANAARLTLRQRLPSSKSRYARLKDDRLVKRPRNPFMHYMLEQRTANGASSSDTSASEMVSIIGQQWRAMDATEKQKYEKLAEQDSSRYFKEFQDVYGYASPTASVTSSPTA